MKRQPIAVAALVWMILGLTGCLVSGTSGHENIPTGPSLPFTVIASGGSSGIVTGRLEVIRDEPNFSALWAAHDLTVGPANTEPSVDFGQEMVIAVFLGQRSTGGYSIGISSIEEGSNNIAVTIEIHIPGSNCGVTTALEEPYQIVKIAQSPKIVAFNESVQVVNCP